MNQLKDELESEILDIEKDIINWRRHIHMYPELSHKEFETKKYIENILKKFEGISIVCPTETSVIGILKGEGEGETIAFKSDIDALPILEAVDTPFRSTKHGIMHACGHDAHAAMLLGAAKILSKYRNRINGTIKFIFQHAEEVIPGGDLDIIKGGYIEDVNEILCIHTNPFIKAGVIATKKGVITASIDKFFLTIQGIGGHSSMPELTENPVVVGSEIVSSIQGLLVRKISPYTPEVIAITQFDTYNEYHSIIPERVTIGGCIRSIDEESRIIIEKEIEKIVECITKIHGVDYDLKYELGHSTTNNNEELTVRVERVVKEHFSTDKFMKLENPYLIGDSFSSYTDIKPGCFVSLGVGNEEIGAKYYSHTDKFTLDETALTTGVRFIVLFSFKKLIGIM